MHLRINDVTVSPARIDELGDVLSNKAEPVLRTQTGFQGLLCAADRATGNCAIVSFWDSKASWYVTPHEHDCYSEYPK